MKQKYYSLAEAAHWIAFRKTDLSLDYIYAHAQEVSDAKDILFDALLKQQIRITSDAGPIIFRESYILDFEFNTIIPPFSCPHELSAPRNNIKISAADMHREFPLVVTGSKIETGYSAPYLEVAIAAINRLGITNDNQPLKKNINDTIKAELASRNLPCSDRKVEALATMIRLPETEKGGNRRLKNN